MTQPSGTLGTNRSSRSAKSLRSTVFWRLAEDIPPSMNWGLGRRINVAGRFLKTDEIFVGLIVIGVIGLALDLLFQYALRVSCRWASQKR